MKARLKSGEIITLEKDCGCITHNGPHWVHMNDIWKEMNMEIPNDGSLGTMGRCQEEQRRLADKLRQLESRGIVELIREDSDALTDEQKKAIAENTRQLLAQNKTSLHH